MEKLELQHTRVFYLMELKTITNEFSKERVIGTGGSGVVYKGVLDNDEVIAVKKLHNRYDSSGKELGNGKAQFLTELMNLIGVQHQNIIRLVGYCYETHNIIIEFGEKHVLASEEEKILCLEYMQGGSLKDHLSDESCGLEWHTRYNIIKGVCEGLKYLHTGSENPIYHLDLKPENILLDRNMIPKISDFGISRLPVTSMQTYDTENAVSGTIGYMAPEYIGQNKISQKCDVYSLGFIMIRVIAGEKGPENYDRHRPSKEFIERVHDNWCRRQKATMSLHALQQVKTCTEIALRCVEYDREIRPTITDIVDELNKIDAAGSSAVGGQNEQTTVTPERQPEILEEWKCKMEHSVEKTKEQVDIRYARALANHTSDPVKYPAQSVDLAKGELGPLLSKLFKFLDGNDLHQRFNKHIKRDIYSLYKQLQGMQNVLLEVAEVPPDQTDGVVKLWCKEVRDLSCQVDKVIDSLLAYQKEEHSIKERKCTMFLIIFFIKKIRQIEARYRIQGSMLDIMKKVNDVAGWQPYVTGKDR